MLSDGLFLKCIDDAVMLQSQFSSQSTYYYMFAHRGQYSATELFNFTAIDLGEKMFCHCAIKMIAVGFNRSMSRGRNITNVLQQLVSRIHIDNGH